ncbi:MAG: DinB family protein [Bacteroidota bacterium]
MASYAEILREILKVSTPRIAIIPLDEMLQKTSLDNWSKQEILGHLIDSAYNNHQRFLRAISQENLIFGGYNQEEWVQRNQYQKRPSEEVLQTWEKVNLHLAHMIEGISPEVLHRVTKAHNFQQICMNKVAADEPMTLSYLIWDYLFHLEHHLAQLIPKYNRMLGSYL